MTGFSIRTKQTLWITLPSTIAFRLEYVLVYQFYAEITIFFKQEMFDLVPICKMLTLKRLAETDDNMTSKHAK